MKTISTRIAIQAPAERVWAELMDFPAYPDWNPFIRRLEGSAEAGARLAATIQPPGGSAMTVRPVVLIAHRNREFRWKGSLPIPGLFYGEHFFQLEPDPRGGTLLTHGEVFTGILVPLLGGLLKKTEEGFQRMNEALRARCETC